MRTMSTLLLAALMVSAPIRAEEAASETSEKPKVLFETSMGRIIVELFPEEAPGSVANFLEYVDEGFYVGTIFHRVIPGFMIQGGGFIADMTKKPVRAGIRNEADNGLRNSRGTIALARTSEPHSATSQFYINTVDNRPLDHRSKDQAGWGYTVFGQVIVGMDVADAIAGVPTKTVGTMRNVPVEAITITEARRLPAAE